VSRPKALPGLTERLARSCSAHPRRVLAAWGLAIVAAIVLAATSLHGLTSNATVTGKPESERAAAAIAAAFPQTAAEQRRESSDVVVVTSDRYTAGSPQFAAFVAQLRAKLHATGKVSNIVTPPLVSKDRHAILLPILVGSDDAIKPVVALAKSSPTPGFAVAVTGTHSAGNDFNTLSQSDLEHGELGFGLPAALLILLLVFGAVVAGLIPILMAIVAIIVGIGIVTLLSLEFSLSVFIVNMLTGMGLALGIDYSLFVISRYREERSGGAEKERAIALAGATASRAVLFSGSIFVVALLGLLIVPTSIMRSLAAGAIVVGVVSVAAALTLLPALLGLLGDRVNALRVPFVGRNIGRADAAESGFWGWIVRTVLRRPGLSLLLSAGAMIAIAVPLLGLHIGASGVTSLPDSMPSKHGYLTLQREFPTQSPYPAQIVVQNASPSGVRARLVALRRQLAADPRFGAGRLQISPSGTVAVLTVPVQGDPVRGPAIRAVRDLRAHVLPAAFAGTGVHALVGGKTAENSEYFDAVTNPTPYVLAFVLGLSLILLMIAFRSLVIAVVSILLNLLSVGAAYGLLTLVFIHGWGAGFFGFERASAIDAWVPLFLFAVLFGLSMDYQVFLISRIKERYDHGSPTREAVETGVASTARIITGAALIIIVVFTGFARGQLVQFQEMGFGVAVALLLDATIIRCVVLPSSLVILGRWTWYLPRWLEWLPHIEVEGPAQASRTA